MSYVDPRLTSNTNYFIYVEDPATIRAEDWRGNAYGGERIEQEFDTPEQAQRRLEELEAPAKALAEEWIRLIAEHQKEPDMSVEIN